MSEVRPLRAYAEVALGRQRSPAHDAGPFMVPYLRAANVKDGTLDLGNVMEMNFTPEEQTTFALADGDVLVTEGSGSLGSVGASAVWHDDLPGPHCFQNTLLRLRPRSRTDPRFLAWWARHAFASGMFASIATGANIYHLSAERVRSLPMTYLEPPEQRAIADYLDRETVRIDALIAAKERMVALARERAARAFDDAVTEFGARSPSAIDDPWVLPAEWLTVNLSQVLVQLTNGYVGPTRDILVDDGIRYIQSLHIKGGKIDFGRGRYFVSPEWHAERPRIQLREGDVLIVQTGDIGQVAVVPPAFGDASCHALQIARVNRSLVSGEYLAAYLRSPFGQACLLSRATGALHPHLEGGIKTVPVVVPPRRVQREIVEAVRAVEERTEHMGAVLARQTEVLRERRQALVTAAVTGQIRVAVPA